MRLLSSTAFWPAIGIWLVFAGAISVLDGQWPLGHLALLLVLGSTLASFWLTTAASMLASAVAVAMFNWFLVSPRHTVHVQLDQDLLLLSTLLGTSTLISVLTSRLRQHAQSQAEHARQAERLQQLALQLQHAESVSAQVQIARGLLQDWLGMPVNVWLSQDTPEPLHPLHRAWQASQQEPGAIGPGTGRYEELSVRVLPLRAGVQRIGTLALGPASAEHGWDDWPVDRLQSLARLLADEVQRRQSDLQARQTQDRLHAQQLRNTLQMARLDTVDAPLQASWESVEELCGAVLAGARRRRPTRRIENQVPAHLPLLWCDPVLVVQLLDNLVENALHYSPNEQPVRLCALMQDGAVQLQVQDRGIGIPAEWRDKVFDPFLRVLPEARGDSGFADTTRRGMGLGLALCQAIARAHQARLWIEGRSGGGTVVCLQFAAQAQPLAAPPENT